MANLSVSWTKYDYDGTETEFTISASVAAIIPAVINRDPNYCHPAEGGEIEDLTITFNGEDVPLSCFSEEDIEDMEDTLAKAATNDGCCDDNRDDYDPDFESALDRRASRCFF